jgi:hypothetical protein
VIAANRYASRGSTPPGITGSTPGANPYRQPAAPSPSASMPNLAPMNAAVSQANRTAMDAWRRDTIAGTKNPALAAALRSLPDRSSPTSAGAPAPVSASQRPGAGVSPPPAAPAPVPPPAAPAPVPPRAVATLPGGGGAPGGMGTGVFAPNVPAPRPVPPRPVSPAATAGAALAAAPTLLPQAPRPQPAVQQPAVRPPDYIGADPGTPQWAAAVRSLSGNSMPTLPADPFAPNRLPENVFAPNRLPENVFAPNRLPENVFAPSTPGLTRPPAQTADDAMPDGIRAKSSATSLHRELSSDEEEAVAAGRGRLMPDLITGAGTPLPATLASPAAGGVLHGLGGAALGSAAGYGLGLLGGQPALGAAAGGLLGGAGGAAHGYLSRRRWNQDAVDLMRRLPPGATLRDYEADAGEGYPQDQLQNLRAMRYIARDLADASHNKGASLGAPVAIGTGRSLSLDLVPARKRRMNPLPGRDREEPEFFGLAGGTQATPPVDPMKGLAARRMG